MPADYHLGLMEINSLVGAEVGSLRQSPQGDGLPDWSTAMM